MSREKSIKKYEMDMCSGALAPKLLVFTAPLILSGILQLMFNAADIVVVGRFAGNNALAAVGSTSSLINLLINVFMGLSVGANVLTARYYGADQKGELSEMVHTAIMTALVSGCILILLGLLLARPVLVMMGTPDAVIGSSVLYMRIFFLGMPASMLYNFGSAILRAVGDTKRPLYYLMAAGLVNVVLNLIFVIVFSMGVAGVALATVIAQLVSTGLVLRCLLKADGVYRLSPGELRIVPDKLAKMVRIGLPAGVQGALFSISNVLIQSSINSFGPVAMAGNTAAGNVEGFVYTSMNAFSQAAVSFTSQNFGAMNLSRVRRVLFICLGMVTVLGLVMGNGVYLISDRLLSLYSGDPEVIAYGIRRLGVIATAYFLCGTMETVVGVLRGMGYSVMPMIVSLTGACGLRVLWIYTVFVHFKTLTSLYWSYPVSWLVTCLVHLICFVVVFRMKTAKTA